MSQSALSDITLNSNESAYWRASGDHDEGPPLTRTFSSETIVYDSDRECLPIVELQRKQSLTKGLKRQGEPMMIDTCIVLDDDSDKLSLTSDLDAISITNLSASSKRNSVKEQMFCCGDECFKGACPCGHCLHANLSSVVIPDFCKINTNQMTCGLFSVVEGHKEAQDALRPRKKSRGLRKRGKSVRGVVSSKMVPETSPKKKEKAKEHVPTVMAKMKRLKRQEKKEAMRKRRNMINSKRPLPRAWRKMASLLDTIEQESVNKCGEGMTSPDNQITSASGLIGEDATKEQTAPAITSTLLEPPEQPQQPTPSDLFYQTSWLKDDEIKLLNPNI